MKHINYIAITLIILITSSLNAELIIEDFESYMDTNALHQDVFSFGSAAQAGRPSLAVGLGENDTNAACFNLTWETGNNANLCFTNLSPNTLNLSGYSEITAFIYIEDYPGNSDSRGRSIPTLVKIAIEGQDGTIWQTRSIKAEKPPVDSSYKLRFRLTPTAMERVEGSGSFINTISEIKNIRLRFENSKRPGFRQDGYIDSIKAVQ